MLWKRIEKKKNKKKRGGAPGFSLPAAQPNPPSLLPTAAQTADRPSTLSPSSFTANRAPPLSLPDARTPARQRPFPSFPSRVRAGFGRESRGRIESCESGISCNIVLYKTPKHRGGFSFASKPRKRALAPFNRDSLDLAEVESSPTAARSSYSLSDRTEDAVDFAVSCSSSRCFSFLKRCSETRSQRSPASSGALSMATTAPERRQTAGRRLAPLERS